MGLSKINFLKVFTADGQVSAATSVNRMYTPCMNFLCVWVGFLDTGDIVRQPCLGEITGIFFTLFSSGGGVFVVVG